MRFGMSNVRGLYMAGFLMTVLEWQGHWCDTTFLKVHALTEEKTDDVKASFYEELEWFNKFS
jgi:hypothetical protein